LPQIDLVQIAVEFLLHREPIVGEYERNQRLIFLGKQHPVYRHAGRYCKWAGVTFVLGVVILVAFYSKSVLAGFVGVVIMFASAVWFERNLRRMGRAGWHDLTRSKDGESKSEGAANGIESAVSDARDWFRSRFHRRDS